MTIEDGRRRDYNDFSLRMSSSLFKRWGVCVVENISRVFLFELASFTSMGNEGIYSMGEG